MCFSECEGEGLCCRIYGTLCTHLLHVFRQIEMSTPCTFVATTGRKRSGQARMRYFTCNRSGRYETQAQPGPKGRAVQHQSRKTGHWCTAFMTCKELDEGAIKVTYCLGHCGHSLDVHGSTLDKQTEAEMVEALRSSNYDVMMALGKLRGEKLAL